MEGAQKMRGPKYNRGKEEHARKDTTEEDRAHAGHIEGMQIAVDRKKRPTNNTSTKKTHASLPWRLKHTHNVMARETHTQRESGDGSAHTQRERTNTPRDGKRERRQTHTKRCQERGDGETQTETQTERHRERDRDTDRETQREAQRDRETERTRKEEGRKQGRRKEGRTSKQVE
jgi:hypothetical protein